MRSRRSLGESQERRLQVRWRHVAQKLHARGHDVGNTGLFDTGVKLVLAAAFGVVNHKRNRIERVASLYHRQPRTVFTEYVPGFIVLVHLVSVAVIGGDQKDAAEFLDDPP